MNNELLLEMDCVAPLEIISKKSKSKKLKHLIKDNFKYFRAKFYLKKETYKIETKNLNKYKIKALIIIKDKEGFIIQEIHFEYDIKDKNIADYCCIKAVLPVIGAEYKQFYYTNGFDFKDLFARKIQKAILNLSKQNSKLIDISNSISLKIIDIKKVDNKIINQKNFDYEYDIANHLKIKETVFWEANYGSMSNGTLYFSRGYRKDPWTRSKKFNPKELKKDKEFLKYKKNYLEKEIFIKNRI